MRSLITPRDLEAKEEKATKAAAIVILFICFLKITIYLKPGRMPAR